MNKSLCYQSVAKRANLRVATSQHMQTGFPTHPWPRCMHLTSPPPAVNSPLLAVNSPPLAVNSPPLAMNSPSLPTVSLAPLAVKSPLWLRIPPL
eukprot:1191559-Prorocentrum_minimum.AAC.1